MNIPELNTNYIQTQYNQSTFHTIAKVNYSDKTADSAGLIKEDSAVTKKNAIDPFRTSDKILETCPLKEQADVIVFDFHAETTSEKQCFAHFVDSRASLVVGTHTHIPTADAQILDGGTGYISDLGMCGDYNSSIGLDKEEPINRFISQIPHNYFVVANGPATLCGICADISDVTGLTEKIAPIRIGARLQQTSPDFWT